jgi:hypothetical protein
VRVCVVLVVVVVVEEEEECVAATKSTTPDKPVLPSSPLRGLRSVEVRSTLFANPFQVHLVFLFTLYIVAPISRVVLPGQFNPTLSLNILRYKLRNWLH